MSNALDVYLMEIDNHDKEENKNMGFYELFGIEDEGEDLEVEQPEYKPKRCEQCRDYHPLNYVGICDRCAIELAQGYKVRSLAGRCANGFEADHGRLFHALSFGGHVALCGAKPGKRSAGWSDWGHGQKATCSRCIKKIEKMGSPE